MAGEKQYEQRLRMKLQRDKATYQTQLSRREVALRLSTDPNVSAERRAKAKADYQRLIKEINTLKNSIAATERNINKEQTKVVEYNQEQGAKDASAIREKYNLLNQAYKIDKDPNIKKQMDALAKDYQAAYSNQVGSPISYGVAKTQLEGGSFEMGGTTSGKQTTSPTPTPAPTPTKTSSSGSTGGSTGDSAKTPTGTIFTQPMTIAGQVDTTAGNADKKVAGLNAADALGLAGTLFEHVPSLKELLDNYVNKGWSDARFLQELRNDPWYKRNSQEIKNRYVQLYNYQDLVASGQADGSTDYEKQIRTLKDQVIKKAREMGSGLASDPAAVQRVAENMYITNTGIDDALTNNLIAAAIRPMGGTIGGKPTEGYSGTALQNYQTLQNIARSNGFTMADIIPGGSNEQQVLQNIATGAIDINRIAQDARRLAAQGQPQYVRDLLGQGYNLDQVYAPYRQTMANILEIDDPNQISLNDPTLRMAITDKGDMNLYDFKKALRQDNRWQYTGTAKQEVSNAALSVLRDFGFQG